MSGQESGWWVCQRCGATAEEPAWWGRWCPTCRAALLALREHRGARAWLIDLAVRAHAVATWTATPDGLLHLALADPHARVLTEIHLDPDARHPARLAALLAVNTHIRPGGGPIPAWPAPASHALPTPRALARTHPDPTTDPTAHDLPAAAAAAAANSAARDALHAAGPFPLSLIDIRATYAIYRHAPTPHHDPRTHPQVTAWLDTHTWNPALPDATGNPCEDAAALATLLAAFRAGTDPGPHPAAPWRTPTHHLHEERTSPC